MQQIDSTNAEVHKDLITRELTEREHVPPRGSLGRHLRRFWPLYLALAMLLGLAVLPPLVNVSRFQRRIATSIGGSLGRPVHLDRVSLSLLPLPGFEIQNLVVDEDPTFGAEPIIRANTVRATLRLSSLWRRRVEFSTISFTEPSLNLVHVANGKWNIEAVLLQASHIEAAPTGQRSAGSTPRFPYIEATGARINFKENQEKTPFSLVESEFALWSPDPNQWRLRLRARPTRTDSSVFDTGTIQLEGTLGRGDSFSNIPINLEGQWRNAPLGEASRVLVGSDAGWRGNMALATSIRGTLGESVVTARLRLLGARRADFVPQQPLSAEVQCFATATAIFHTYEDLRCSWAPDPGSTSEPPIVALTGAVPDVRRIETARLQVGTSGVPASTVLSWLRVLSPGISEDISASGNLAGSLFYDGPGARHWDGQFTLRDAGLKTSSMASGSLITGDLQLRLVPATAGAQPAGLVLGPASIMLGGHDPATLEGRFDSKGYSLHLAGAATQERLKEFAAAIAPLGTGLIDSPEISPAEDGPPAQATTGKAPERAAPPSRVDMTSAASWSDPHEWRQAASHQTPAVAHRAH